jgi:hypothetical protein
MDIEPKFDFFENLLKLIYGTIKYNRFGIWWSQSGNMEFRSVFAASRRFFVKPWANTYGFWTKI